MSARQEPGLFTPCVRVSVVVERAQGCREVAARSLSLDEVESSPGGVRRAILAEAEAAIDKLLKAGML